MAIYVYCPSCNTHLEDMSATCPHCGTGLPPGVLHTLAMARGETPESMPDLTLGTLPRHVASPPSLATLYLDKVKESPLHYSPMRPWLAAALSSLCGLGQLYNGQIVKGLVFLLGGIILVLTWHLPVSKVLAPALWGYALVDAYLVARRMVSQRP